jgi:hypothetical protein
MRTPRRPLDHVFGVVIGRRVDHVLRVGEDRDVPVGEELLELIRSAAAIAEPDGAGLQLVVVHERLRDLLAHQGERDHGVVGDDRRLPAEKRAS